jgi:hypothetical protein
LGRVKYKVKDYQTETIPAKSDKEVSLFVNNSSPYQIEDETEAVEIASAQTEEK